jgi:hypothetical protein
MKSKNKYIQLKKYEYLQHLTDDGLISQIIVYYGDAINMIREATVMGNFNFKESLGVVSDLILCTARLDIALKRKRRAWWSGEVTEESSNLHINQFLFISGLYKILDADSDKETLNDAMHNLQRSVEMMAFAFGIDIIKLLDDLVLTQNSAEKLIEEEYSPEGIFTMDLVTDKNKYSGIKLDDKTFKSGVLVMDFFEASIHAVKVNRKYGVKISDTLKEFIDEESDDFYTIKFYNHQDDSDNTFYTLVTEGNTNKLFKGDEDVTESVSIERKGITIIPFVDYSMVLATPDMQTLDDLLDYYNSKH